MCARAEETIAMHAAKVDTGTIAKIDRYGPSRSHRTMRDIGNLTMNISTPRQSRSLLEGKRLRLSFMGD
jgi:hypothetical protein